MLTFPVRARSLKELQSMAEPQVVKGGQSEALAWIFYDTATYVSATTINLSFFTTTRANPQLSNLNGRGLPSPQYFEGYYFGLDILRVPGNTDVLGDYWRIVNGTGVAGQGGPTWTFTLADKKWGPFPLTAFHGLGGPQGFSTRTAQEYSNNGPADGGFCGDGAMVIPPNQTFSIDLTWPAAVTLSGNVDVRPYMAGVLHRRVL